MRSLAELVIGPAVAAALAISAGLRDRLAEALRGSSDWQQFFQLAMQAVFAFEPMLQRTLSDATFSAYLAAGKPLLPQLPPQFEAGGMPSLPFLPGPSVLQILERTADYPQVSRFQPPIVPVRPTAPAHRSTVVYPFQRPAGSVEPGGGEPLIRFPLIEKAAQDLAERKVMTRPDFDRASAAAKREAFTVARVSSIETLTELRDNLSKAVAEGRSLRDFRKDASKIIDGSGPLLTPGHVETVFRTNVATAYSAGQQGLLRNPVVNALFPYVRWTAVHDRRTEPSHLAMETAGLNGTAVFRADDPLILAAWPPARWNCRCHCIILSVKSAAKLGVEEAIRWRETGVPPTVPAFVASIPLKVPSGWVGGRARSLAV